MFLFALLGLASASVQIEPLYWNASNPIFAKGQSAQLEVNVGEKLDIYCPQRIREPIQTDQPLYLKGFLVSEADFKSCVVRNAAEAKKIFTCNTPDQEKKHTILFQEINPNPFGLTFHRGAQYFLISTADGTANGIGSSSGGVCDRHNMKIQIRVSEAPDAPISEADSPKTRSSMKIQPLVPWDTREIAAEMEEFESEELEIDLAQSSGFTIGIIIGAFTAIRYPAEWEYLQSRRARDTSIRAAVPSWEWEKGITIGNILIPPGFPRRDFVRVGDDLLGPR